MWHWQWINEKVTLTSGFWKGDTDIWFILLVVLICYWRDYRKFARCACIFCANFQLLIEQYNNSMCLITSLFPLFSGEFMVPCFIYELDVLSEYLYIHYKKMMSFRGSLPHFDDCNKYCVSSDTYTNSIWYWEIDVYQYIFHNPISGMHKHHKKYFRHILLQNSIQTKYGKLYQYRWQVENTV